MLLEASFFVGDCLDSFLYWPPIKETPRNHLQRINEEASQLRNRNWLEAKTQMAKVKFLVS